MLTIGHFSYIHPLYQRKGIMRDAILALLTWATKEGGVTNVMVQVEEDNAGSIRLIESLPVFMKISETREVSWPVEKGGGNRRILTWRWHYNP
jgi:RimJ/RimL family protein N-acetyltransferase